MSTFQELLAQRAALETEIQTAKAEERSTKLKEIKRLVDEFAFSTREIDLRRDIVTNQAVSRLSILSESSQARRTVAGGWYR